MIGDWSIAEVAAPANLLLAAHKARKKKSRRPDVEEFFLRLESNVLRLSRQLASGAWQPSGYRTFEIREPKRRIISAAPFADRVVHHALCNFLQPALERRFIAHSFSCQVGKGTTAAREHVRKLVNKRRYVLKCDVRKFFDSIDHACLLERLRTGIDCDGAFRLARRIIEGHAATPGRGLPIGNLTSQLWGNFMLDEMDHWITEELRIGAYARYTDDFLLFADDKARLWDAWADIIGKLGEIRLHLAEPKSRLLKCSEGVPFCGFRFLPGLRPRVLGATKRRFEKRKRRLIKSAVGLAELSRSVFAWYQFSREGNTYGLRKEYTVRRNTR
jgi:retron-type reverse transcriptase